MRKTIKKLVKKLKSLAKADVAKLVKIGLAFGALQVKIRPRARLFGNFLGILTIAYGISSWGVSLLVAQKIEAVSAKPAILLAGTQQLPAEPVGVSYQISFKHSPFEFERPVEGYVSQGYSRYHLATDIATAFASEVRVVGPGVVEFAGRLADGKGNVVVVNHGEGLKSLYAHLGPIAVGVGNQVRANSILGRVGLSGRTTGPHVHLEIYDNDRPVDPEDILPETLLPLAQPAAQI